MTAFYQPGNLLDAIGSFDRGSFGGNAGDFMRDVKVPALRYMHAESN